MRNYHETPRDALTDKEPPLSLNDSSCPLGHNAPLPLERSPPGSFKRLLGGLPSLTPLIRHSLGRRQTRVDRSRAPVAPRCRGRTVAYCCRWSRIGQAEPSMSDRKSVV